MQNLEGRVVYFVHFSAGNDHADPVLTYFVALLSLRKFEFSVYSSLVCLTLPCPIKALLWWYLLQMLLMYRLQRLKRYIDMPLRGEWRKEDVAYYSLFIDDIRHTSRQSEGRRHSIADSDYATRVTQQDERELILFGELPM